MTEAVRSFKTLVVDFFANSLAFLIPWAFRASSPNLCPFYPMQGAHLWRLPARVHAGALCHSKDSWQETGVSTPSIISFLFSHLVKLQNVLDMTMEQAMKQTQLLLWHVKWRERPAILIFASKLSFMTGNGRKMCRTSPLFLVQMKVTQDLNNSIWSCDSMRSKFFDFANQDADSGTFFTSSVFTLPLNKNSQSQRVMFGSQYNTVYVSLWILLM